MSQLDTPHSVRIAAAAETDLPDIAQLAGVIWRACYPGIITHAQIDYMLARMYALDVMREEIRAQAIHYDMLSLDGRPSGFAAYGPTEVGTPRRGVRTAQRAVPTFKLHKLYLLPEHQGCGLGSRLLQHVECKVRRLGASRLILAVNKRNAKAIAAYKRNGFGVVESVVTDIGGGFVMDDYVMAKDLVACS
ncbi:MAG TPA: bifunctional aminotransferase class I/II-fold pyridoxal phosphate-dependent enzyme/GNAT family N-acetyltransferase [Candidatus Acidoferrum sp.]|nr:bifunctional aminotransferase class I/II-fold pyridoxal phosphate-dependent enzyme/GNAT family N-acetyltransferase [Candidatus Acidoferrum sp.]